ncbi:hypothetical protein LOZ53_003820 [Ophidiomyces ophidiicola]|uniref:Uncharacterized protein n=1 Tax=Ophidiomyces ophidiicola TaxID=1387563 RepID=A0ACB8V1D7_9EURO|nr:uncharacterized protein LOZ57_004346 [Ophidiomyces ophidiicola]KAI1909425.1 hypothetical protein LOZ64_005254 [Ophidiomyces ophidiicola]KAI1914890.1 hypothetical protein LOZ61_002027 [Ophidiomyces ophidiicola]KAI1924782.1 hypothetical protein LOZ60_004514 [Ophidiomyces ophidiicola]KAI1945315.1 hypothetical protein LOZ57_004346 [Ophidiomyces ophidiicola]KAI1953195.1 hypothetical protein LOZ59_005237 [Ophidiomyces ophidiicola]
MAPRKKTPKAAPSFEAIIHAARDRRKKQASTDKFFSQIRSANSPAAKKPSRKEASQRIEKRSVSVSIGKQEPTRRPPPRHATREARLLSSALPERDMNIRGRATGPTVVLGSNFAFGTTAEDIQSAFEPVGGQMLRCTLIATYPAVMAEMTFADRRGADNVVTKFNNQKADGKVLHIRIKPEIT